VKEFIHFARVISQIPVLILLHDLAVKTEQSDSVMQLL
jgi:hypothetical protein